MIAMVRTDSMEVRRPALALGSSALSETGGLPAVLDVPSAGRLLGIGRTRAYRLAAAGVRGVGAGTKSSHGDRALIRRR